MTKEDRYSHLGGDEDPEPEHTESDETSRVTLSETDEGTVITVDGVEMTLEELQETRDALTTQQDSALQSPLDFATQFAQGRTRLVVGTGLAVVAAGVVSLSRRRNS